MTIEVSNTTGKLTLIPHGDRVSLLLDGVAVITAVDPEALVRAVLAIAAPTGGKLARIRHAVQNS